MMDAALARRSSMVVALGWLVACTIPPGEDDGTSAEGSGPLDDGTEEGESTGAPAPATTSAEGGGEAGSSAGLSFTSTDGSGGDPGLTDDGTSSEPPTDDAGDAGDAGEPPLDCTALARDCAAFAMGELVLFELDTGVVLETLPVPFDSSFSSHSIAWVDDGVYVCSGPDSDSETLQRVDVQTGLVVDSMLPCSGVTELDGQLLVRHAWLFATGDYALYADFAAVLANTPLSVTSYPPNVHRFTIADDTLVSAWHSTDRLEIYDLATGALVSSPVLEGYDHWIRGMDVIGGQVVVSTWFDDPLRQIAFDVATGERTCELPSVGMPLDFIDGLACRESSVQEPPPPPPPA